MSAKFESPVVGADAPFVGWRSFAPREEICPRFSCDAQGGRDGAGALIIEADDCTGLDGWWNRSFPVNGGKHYRFHVLYRARNVKAPRRSVVVKMDWFDAEGRAVPEDNPVCTGYLPGYAVQAETEHPKEGATDSEGWTEVSHIYCAPSQATQASVELHLQWASNSRVE